MRTMCLVLGLAALSGFVPAADAAEKKACLGVDERRIAIAAHKALPLGKAMRLARARSRGEVIRAALCERGGRLIYVLTVLGRDGKVTRLNVDAGSGTIASGH